MAVEGGALLVFLPIAMMWMIFVIFCNGGGDLMIRVGLFVWLCRSMWR